MKIANKIKLFTIKKGASRIVFIFKKFVVKIPNYKHFRLGILSNCKENYYSTFNNTNLLKVLFCDPLNLFLVMERVITYEEIILKMYHNLDNPCPYIDRYELTEQFEQVVKYRVKNDILSYLILEDLKPENYGLYENNLVKIDYGHY